MNGEMGVSRPTQGLRPWRGGSLCSLDCGIRDSPALPAASYPLPRVQEDLGVKELVAVTVLALPLGHQFAEVGGITDETWGLHGDTETDT